MSSRLVTTSATFFTRSELLTSEFQPVTSFWGPPPRTMGD